MFTRRQVLKGFGIAGASMILPWGQLNARDRFEETLLNPAKLTKFIDPLPFPRILRSSATLDGRPFYNVGMSQFAQNLHSELPDTVVWGYQGAYPGPTFEARTGEPIYVKWENQLPAKHLFPVDHTVFGAYPPEPDVRAVVHLHGGHVSAESDGNPEAWFTSAGQKGPLFTSDTYYYPNDQHAASLWYHDHALAITRLNVYAGLAGLYLLRDEIEDALNLPKGKYEVPLVIQDRRFNKKGQLFYPVSDIPHAPWVPEFFGNVILVNGKVWPRLDVEPRKYRFRIYNGSNARFYDLKLSSGQSFFQIGNEGGLLPAPVQLTKILLAPAERADVIVDFSQNSGSLRLQSSAGAPFPFGKVQSFDIMQFNVVKKLKGSDTSVIPAELPRVERLSLKSVAKRRTLALEEGEDPEVPGRLLLMINGKDYDAPITERPRAGTKEIWRLVNTTADSHPIHLHLVQFQILDRQPVDVARFLATREIHLTGPRVPPAPNERGWKDTVRVDPQEIVRIITRFGGQTGRYVWHCHILEHEDNEMMRIMDVI